MNAKPSFQYKQQLRAGGSDNCSDQLTTALWDAACRFERRAFSATANGKADPRARMLRLDYAPLYETACQQAFAARLVDGARARASSKQA